MSGVAVLFLAACTATPKAALTLPVTSATSTPSATSSPLATPTPVSCVQQVFSSLPVSSRIGQLFMLGLEDNHFEFAQKNAINTRHFGSVWFTETETHGRAWVRAITESLKKYVGATGGVGFFIAANQEGGEIQ